VVNAGKPSGSELPRPSGLPEQRLGALAVQVGGTLRGADVAVRGVTAASSRVRAGDLFAALAGGTGHGARFSAEAAAAGAVAVLTDQAGLAMVDPAVPAIVVDDVRRVLGPLASTVYGCPSRRLQVLGVTGTSGKTTTTFFIRAGLSAAGITSGLVGTVATYLGDEPIKTGLTTPEAPDMQALLAVMAERGSRAAAIEVSSHALRMGRADGIDFAVGAFTNLSQDHLDFHDDMEDYFAAKSTLFDGRSRQVAVVTDDEWGRRLVRAAIVPEPPLRTVSTADAAAAAEALGVQVAAWRAVEVEPGAAGTTTFRVLGPGVDLRAGCAVPGVYNVANVLLALAVLDAAGVPAEVAAPAVATASVPGRMQRVEAGQAFLAVVDYSHKPAAVEGALRALRQLTPGRLIIVLGCGGDRDRAKRPVMGQVAGQGADVLIVTDDNPRSEDPAEIRRAMLAGAHAAPGAGEVREIGDRGEAIAAAVRLAVAGDTVLVAGKGHETGQEVGDEVISFDDVDVLTRAIRAVTR
jgi:UDP-N-acetylmuramoyl-L-alanyl-D-glutamate--2,6-diaminopimelate ligase